MEFMQNMENSEREKNAKIDLIVKKIFETCFRKMLMEMRFMDVAYSKLKPTPSTKVKYLDTNGVNLYYNAEELILRYKTNPNQVTHDIMHLLLHCVFKHLSYKNILPNFHLACDIAIEQTMSTFDAPCLKVSSRDKNVQKDLSDKDKYIKYIEKIIKEKKVNLTPQNIALFLNSEQYNQEQIQELDRLFNVDSHDFWYEVRDKQDGKGGGDAENSIQLSKLSWDDVEKAWGNISNTVAMNMESFQKDQGDTAGGFHQKLKELNREPFDYSRFLKKFAKRQEVTKINPDEFDYIFYTYGLNEYDNMPLIEPLEYKDSRVIKDFVIAIDTSGSTSGDVVQHFLQKTYNILKSTESFARTINLYIIQCDAAIQETVLIQNEMELEDYIQNLVIKGLGGTDFRPVFEHVKEKIAEGIFTNLKGLLYFTDGYGTFPIEKTPYETAFVFIVKEDYERVVVPPWAMKVLLTENQILEFKQSEETKYEN